MLGVGGSEILKKIINHELIKSIFYHKKYPKYFYDGKVALLLVYQLMINKAWGMALNKTNNMATSKISKKENDVKKTFLFSNVWFFF